MQASDIEGIPTGPVSAFGDLENRIMSDIVRRIQINASITRSADWQITRLTQLGQSSQEIKKAIQDTLKLSDKAIDDIYAEAVKAEYIRDAELYQAVGKTAVSFADNVELQQLMEAVKKQTKDEFLNISNSLGFVTQENGKLKALDITTFYQKTLDKAIGDISSGAFSYSESLRRTVKDMTNSGLRWIDYESGYHNRVTVAARRATMTGFNQTMSHINEKTAEDLGTDSFEVTWHAGARESHQWFAGKVFTKKQLIEECGLGTVEGIKGANCYHDYLAFVPGASVRTYTDEQLKQMNDAENTPKKYNGKEYTTSQALQRQRQLETNMRAQRQEIGLLKQGGADEIDIQNAMSRYQGTSAEYTGLSAAMGLPQQRERVTIDSLGGIGKKAVKEGNSIEIDELTPCLRRVSDGKIVKTTVKPISLTRSDTKGWEFDWTKPEKDGYDVFALYAEGDSRIQGLVSTQMQKGAVKVGIVESAPFNSRHNIAYSGAKEYTGVGGHLFAEAVKQSYAAGYQGVVFFQAKTNLIDYYAHELGAELSNPRDRLMMISEEAASKLYGKYY